MSLVPALHESSAELEQTDIVFPFAFPEIPSDDPERGRQTTKIHRGRPKTPPRRPNDPPPPKYRFYQVPIASEAIETWSLMELIDAVLALECDFALLGCQPWNVSDARVLATRYRKMQLRLHPDKVRLHNDAELLKRASEASQKVSLAYSKVINTI